MSNVCVIPYCGGPVQAPGAVEPVLSVSWPEQATSTIQGISVEDWFICTSQVIGLPHHI